MELRAPTRDDLPRLLVLVEALARHHGEAPSATLASLEADLFGPGPWLHALVAEEAGAVVGYVAVLRLARFHLGQRGIDLHHLYVDEAHRGHGIGGALVAEALSLGGRLGASYATVTATPANASAQAFYKSLGFQDAPRFGARFWAPIAQGTRFA